MPESLNKVRKLSAEAKRQGLNLEIQIDGGINAETAPLAVEAGVTVLVAGNYIFSAENVEETVKHIKSL